MGRKLLDKNGYSLMRVVDEPEFHFRDKSGGLQCRHGVTEGINKGGYQNIEASIEDTRDRLHQLNISCDAFDSKSGNCEYGGYCHQARLNDNTNIKNK